MLRFESGRYTLTLLAATTALLAAGGARALGTSQAGNAPLAAANYTDWPGLVTTINHPSRVFQTWVNGNEHFFYRGDTAALNECLARFAESKVPLREVVLRPGLGKTQSFDQTQTVEFGWVLHIVGGIAKHLTTLERGDRVWATHPVLTIYVGRDFDLGALRFPEGLIVSSVEEVKKRTREGLESKDKTVRGWSTGVLAELDAFDDESRDAIAALLRDSDNWVRLNAAGSLGVYGRKAQKVLPALKGALDTGDEQLRTRLETVIAEIEKAPDRAAIEKEQAAITARIAKFLEERRK